MFESKNKYSLFFLWLFSLQSLVFIACKNSSINDSKKSVNSNPNRLSVIDTININKPCVIFIEPDSTLIEKLKQANGEDAFFEQANDYLSYLTAADDFCKAEGVQTYFITNSKVVQFIGNNSEISFLNVQHLSSPWAVCFFQPSKNYKLIEISLFEEEYQYYFHNN